MNIIKIEELEKSQNPHGVELRKVFENDIIGVMNIILKPGQELPKHHNPINALFLVLEGSGTVTVGDEEQKVTKNTIIEVPENAARGWKNDTNELLKLLVIKIL